MGYRSLRECVEDLAAGDQLVRIEKEIDPHLEAAEIQRRVFRAGGPAIYFARVKGCRFPLVGHLFRDSLEGLRRLVSLKVDPVDMFRRPRMYLRAPWFALNIRPKKVRTGAVLAHETTLDQLPQLKSWPDDAGAYITLPDR